MAGGRPMKFPNSKKLEDTIKSYFKHCDKTGKPYTIAGLAVWLDVDRHTIYNYEKKEEFFHIIKKARDVILASWEERVISEGKPGQIFLMKNYGYTDKQEVQNTNYNHEISDDAAKAYLKKHGMID